VSAWLLLRIAIPPPGFNPPKNDVTSYAGQISCSLAESSQWVNKRKVRVKDAVCNPGTYLATPITDTSPSPGFRAHLFQIEIGSPVPVRTVTENSPCFRFRLPNAMTHYRVKSFSPQDV